MVSIFGIVLASAYLLSVFLFWRWGKREGFSSDDLFDLALLVSLAGLGGGKLLPLWVAVPEGFFWTGAILAGVLALYLYTRVRRLPFLRLGSLSVLAASFGQAVVFLGAGALRLQPLFTVGGHLLMAAVLFFSYGKSRGGVARPPALAAGIAGVVFFLYLILEGALLYFAGGWGAPVLAGLGVIGLAGILIRSRWIAIRGVFKVKRSDG